MAGSGSSGSAASVPAAEWSTIYEMTTWLKENKKILYVNGCFTDTTVEQTHYSKFCGFCLSRAAFSAQLPLSIVHQGIGQTKRHTRGPPCRGKPVIFPYGTFRDGAGTAACIGRTGEEVLERVYCNFPQGRMSRNGPNPPFGREGGGSRIGAHLARSRTPRRRSVDCATAGRGQPQAAPQSRLRTPATVPPQFRAR